MCSQHKWCEQVGAGKEDTEAVTFVPRFLVTISETAPLCAPSCWTSQQMQSSVQYDGEKDHKRHMHFRLELKCNYILPRGMPRQRIVVSVHAPFGELAGSLDQKLEDRVSEPHLSRLLASNP